jgi:hypothetical protein
MLTLTPNMKVAPEEEGFEPPELLVSEMRELLIVALRY